MSKIKVLVTSVGSVTAQGVFKGLMKQREFDYKLIGTDMTKYNAGKLMVDRFYQIKPANDKKYINQLIGICKKERIDILIPIHDNELLKVAKNKGKFKKINCLPVISSEATIKICNNKYWTYKFLKRIGINVVETYTIEEVINRKFSVAYPCIIKPNNGIAAIDVYKVNNFNGLYKKYKELKSKWESIIVQPLINGTEFSIDVFCNFNSEVIGIVPRTRDDTRHGASIQGITVKDIKLIKQAKYIAEKLKIIGSCNIQCFKVGRNYKFFEINPRFSATYAHSLMAGLNSILWLFKLLDGQKVKPRIGEFKNKLRMYRFWMEEFEQKAYAL